MIVRGIVERIRQANFVGVASCAAYLILFAFLGALLAGAFVLVRGGVDAAGAFLRTPAATSVAQEFATATGSTTVQPKTEPTLVPTLLPTVEPTAAPTEIPPPAPASNCFPYEQASAHIGETTCVRGVVFNTYFTNTAFFIDFDGTHNAFFGSSVNGSFNNLIGKCVEIRGLVDVYKGRPYILFNANQFQFCP